MILAIAEIMMIKITFASRWLAGFNELSEALADGRRQIRPHWRSNGPTRQSECDDALLQSVARVKERVPESPLYISRKAII
jgi:hypothetical protein